MTDNIIPKTTAAATSNPFRVIAGMPVAVRAFGLAGAETAKIQISRGDGTETYDDITESSGTMTSTEPQTSIVAGGLFRVVKTATASAAGVSKD